MKTVYPQLTKMARPIKTEYVVVCSNMEVLLSEQYCYFQFKDEGAFNNKGKFKTIKMRELRTKTEVN